MAKKQYVSIERLADWRNERLLFIVKLHTVQHWPYELNYLDRLPDLSDIIEAFFENPEEYVTKAEADHEVGRNARLAKRKEEDAYWRAHPDEYRQYLIRIGYKRPGVRVKRLLAETQPPDAKEADE